MKSARMHEFGGPEVMSFDEIVQPLPKGDEVLIKVSAASINPVDSKIREGNYPVIDKTNLPYTLGCDISGRIVAMGEMVEDYAVDDEVFAYLDCKRGGGYSEFAIARVGELARVPTSVDAIRSVALGLAGITGWQGLFDHGELESGQRVLIHGGAGGIGHLAIQFAKARGAWVATTAAAEDSSFVLSLGADLAIDYQAERFEEKVGTVDLVFCLIPGETRLRSYSIIKQGGRLVSTLVVSAEEKAKAKGLRVISYTAEPNGSQLAEIAQLVDNGRVRVNVDKTFRLDQFAEAQNALETEHIQGKIVMTVG
jgi:NADPH:quinone reductase-like Zn-dependent oxidoreductase